MVSHSNRVVTKLILSLTLVCRNLCGITLGTWRCAGIPLEQSYHKWRNSQAITCSSQSWGIKAPSGCSILWLWAVSFGNISSATQAVKILSSSWIFWKQRSWNTSIELGKSEWRYESSSGKVTSSILKITLLKIVKILQKFMEYLHVFSSKSALL